MITEAKFQQRLNTMTAMSKKVFEAVPISAPWPVTYILAELQRLGFSVNNHRVVAGCLNSLIDAKLIHEPTKGSFVRAPFKREPQAAPIPSQPKESMPITQSSAAPRSPLDLLSELSSRATAMALAMQQLVSDIESAALEIDQSLEKAGADSLKLRQLQALLKGAD